MDYKFPVFYPGHFATPTKYHLNTALWLSSQPEIGSVIVVVGNEDGISPEIKKKLWELMLSSVQNPNISIQSAPEGSIKYIYDKMMQEPTFPAYIALDEKSSRKEEFSDQFNKFPNLEVELISSQYEDFSKKMRQALEKGEKNLVKKYLPDSLKDDKVQEAISIMNSKAEPVQEDETDNSYASYKQKFVNTFDKQFWVKNLALEEAVSLDEMGQGSSYPIQFYPHSSKYGNPTYFFEKDDGTYAVEFTLGALGGRHWEISLYKDDYEGDEGYFGLTNDPKNVIKVFNTVKKALEDFSNKKEYSDVKKFKIRPNSEKKAEVFKKYAAAVKPPDFDMKTLSTTIILTKKD